MRFISAVLVCGLAGVLASCSPSTSSDKQIPPSPTPPSSITAQSISGTGVKARTIHHGPRSVNRVAITLDADFSPSAAAHVENGTYPRQVNSAAIKYLEDSKTPATVFVTGMWAQTYASELKRLAGNPLVELGNHTWNHDAWTRNCYGLPYVGSDSAKIDSLRQTNKIVKNLTGVTMRYARMPGLCHNKSDERLIADESLQSVDIDVSTTDAFASSAQSVAKAMLTKVKPGSILLMHLNGAPNAPIAADILKIIVPGLKAKGLEPVTVGVLLQQ